MRTQWRTASGMAFVRLGLDYAAIPVVLDGYGITDPERRRALFDDLRVMEGAALKAYADAAESGDG